MSWIGVWRNQYGSTLDALWHVVSSAALTAGREGEPARRKALEAVHAFHTGLDHFERVG